MMQVSSLSAALTAVSPAPAQQGASRPWQDALQAVTQSPQDNTSLSPEGVKASRESSEKQQDTSSPEQPFTDEKAALTAEELKQLSQLKSRDREVRTHEQAHLSVAGQHAAGGASYTFQRGPDGNSYAVGGEVPIDISGESTPEATLQKMRTIRRAALAPAEPSSADRQIAAQASAKELQAMQEITAELQKELSSIVSTAVGSEKNESIPATPAAGTSTPDTPVHDNARKIMIAAYQRQSHHGLAR